MLNLANLDPTDIVKIFTINGQIIYQGNMNRINTTNWKNGIYEVIITHSKGSESQLRVVK